jgi:hypothetical protein
MPILAAYFGFSGSNFLVERSPSSSSSGNPELNSNSNSNTNANSNSKLTTTQSKTIKTKTAKGSKTSISAKKPKTGTPSSKKKSIASQTPEIAKSFQLNPDTFMETAADSTNPTDPTNTNNPTSTTNSTTAYDYTNQSFEAGTAGSIFASAPSTISIPLSFENREFDFYFYPYTYFPNLFSHYITEENFYKQMFDQFLAENKIKISNYDVLVTNPGSSPYIKAKNFVPFEKLFEFPTDINPVFVNYQFVQTKTGFFRADYSQIIDNIMSKNPVLGEDKNLNFFSNLPIYPHLRNPDIKVQTDMDRVLVNAFKHGNVQNTGAFLFSGGRFFNRTGSIELDYILLTELLQDYGIYDVFLDKQNAFTLISLVNYFSVDKPLLTLTDYVERVGTMLRLDGGIECSLTTDLGSSQVFDLPENDIYIVPLDENTSARLFLKNRNSGETYEKLVRGGSLGIVFNTMQNSKFIGSDPKLQSRVLKQFTEALSRI